jgi:hypothetical protein
MVSFIGSFAQLIGPVVGGYAFGWSIEYRDFSWLEEWCSCLIIRLFKRWLYSADCA